jgi:transposase
MPKKKAQVAVMRTQMVAAHALLSDPEADYLELGPGYHDQRAGAHRQARGHVRSLERLGYKVTIEPVDPDTGELTAKAS